MKRFYQIILLSLFLTLSIFSQENLSPNDFTNLLAQGQTAKKFKEIKFLISKAEDIFNSQKKKHLNNPDELARLSFNFASFRIGIKDILSKKLYTPGNSDDELRIFHKIYPNNSEEISNLLRETIEIYEQNLKVENINLAIAKFELANFYENYVPKNKQYSGFEGHIKRLNEIQDLYLRSLVLQEKLLDKNLDKNNDLLLATTYQLAKNYSQMADYENALIYYEKNISGISEKYGQKSENLLTALISIGAIWQMLDQKDSFEKIKKQISEITNEKPDFDKMHLLISARAKSFKYKGIYGASAKMIGGGPVGIRKGGTDLEAADFDTTNSIRERPETKPPNFSIIIPRDSKLKFTNLIKTIVEVDENGKVFDAKAETDVLKIKEKVEREVKKWEFKPFIFQGKKMKMKGFVYYYNL